MKTLDIKSVIAQHGNTPVYFAHYYKYSFDFVAVLKGGKLLNVYYGGSSSSIYKFEVYYGNPPTLNWLIGDSVAEDVEAWECDKGDIHVKINAD